MNSSTKEYLPDSNDALISWSENFLRELKTIGKFLGIEKQEIDFLESMILRSMNTDIKLSNGKFSKDFINNLKTQRQEINLTITELITRLEKHPLYLKDFHGKKLGGK